MDVKEKQQEKLNAMTDLKRNVSELSSVVAENVKVQARAAIDDTLSSARQKIETALNVNEIKAFAKEHPKLTLAAAFGVGAFIGLGKLKLLRAPTAALFGFGLEVLRKNAADSFRNYIIPAISEKTRPTATNYH